MNAIRLPATPLTFLWFLRKRAVYRGETCRYVLQWWTSVTTRKCKVPAASSATTYLCAATCPVLFAITSRSHRGSKNRLSISIPPRWAVSIIDGDVDALETAAAEIKYGRVCACVCGACAFDARGRGLRASFNNRTTHRSGTTKPFVRAVIASVAL